MPYTAATMLSPESRHFAVIISWLCGWVYFCAWSVSFYPQPLLNLRRQTTQGLMPDFPTLNVLGFACYTTSTAVFLFSPTIRQQYALRHPRSPEPTVRSNDLAFGIHALVLCLITYSQFWPRLWGWKQPLTRYRKVTRMTLGLIWGSTLGMAIIIVIVVANNHQEGYDATGWAWIDVMYGLWYVKLLMTVFKYVPQVMANFRRKSTMGWSISQVLLDLFGGILSMVQLLIDSRLQGDWSGLTGNPVKFGLANISMIFDIIFIFQHYVLYGPVEEKLGSHSRTQEDSEREPADEQRPLLAN